MYTHKHISMVLSPYTLLYFSSECLSQWNILYIYLNLICCFLSSSITLSYLEVGVFYIPNTYNSTLKVVCVQKILCEGHIIPELIEIYHGRDGWCMEGKCWCYKYINYSNLTYKFIVILIKSQIECFYGTWQDNSEMHIEETMLRNSQNLVVQKLISWSIK